MSIVKMTDLSLAGKRVLIRQDLNVPIKHSVITSDKRICASLSTIKYAIEAGAKIMLMSHLGRPVEGQPMVEFSLTPVAQKLSDLLGQSVNLVTNYLDQAPDLSNGDVVLLENVRFNTGEKSNDKVLAKSYASLCDIFVMDAFGVAHRSQASTHGVGKYVQIACAGPLLIAELDALTRVLENPVAPVVAIVGGSKVSSKLTVLNSLAKMVDQLIPGGGIANTFIAAAGYMVGKSVYEKTLVPVAQQLIQTVREKGGGISIVTDVVVGQTFSEDATATIKDVKEVTEDDMILDIGPYSTTHFVKMIKTAGTIIWNGPVGVFEFDQFGEGTKALSLAISQSNAFTIAGGGDTLAAIDKYGVADKISYISTGGGAFLEFIEGKKLPAVAILENRYEL